MTVDKEYTEGKTTFFSVDLEHYKGDQGQSTTDLPVFYNPRMTINRDFSVLFLSTYMERNSVNLICEPLAGSGVRTLRYLNECSGDFHAKLFDVNPAAIEMARRNIERYDFQNRAEIMKGDAKVLLLTESREKRFDFVDIDPFGSPDPYLNAAIQSLRPQQGLLGITATDMPALCGVYPNVALRKYGGFSIRAPFCHEIAVRLLIGSVYRIAGMNDCTINPLAVLSTDHYIRVWLRIRANRIEANEQSNRIGMIRYCRKCMQIDSVPLRACKESNDFAHQKENCEGEIVVAGPLWTGELYDRLFLETAKSMLSNGKFTLHKHVPRILDRMLEECNLTDCTYIDIHALCDIYNLIPPKMTSLIENLVKLKYNTTRTHFKHTAIRTNAPVREIVDKIQTMTEEE